MRSTRADDAALQLAELLDRFEARVDVQLLADAADVAAHRVDGDVEGGGDLFVLLALAERDEDVALAFGQRVVFFCLAGDQLGLDAVAKGARAFLGFDDVLTNYVKQPSLFGQGVDKAATALVLSGKTVGTTRSALEKHFKQIEGDYQTGPHRGHVDATVIWLAAHINWRGLVVHGKASATV